ncbi:MAG TPA: radical SAM protein [Hyphomicrobiaceae bacterium]|nr:radical SAM protein [Hyphomicrobiaceae bacterium]
MNADGRVLSGATRPLQKFEDPDWTAKGERRATVPFARLQTLWFNTGTLCNITCASCYIESSPKNDRLVYLSAAEVVAFYDEILAKRLGTKEIGLTGGEPFMNPDIIAIIEEGLERGFEVLVLSNAMQPMQRPRIKKELLRLNSAYGRQLKLRISLDHFTRELHERERGPKSWEKALAGIDWLSKNGFTLAIAGRTCWGESEPAARAGYAELIAARRWQIDANDHAALHLLPEMNEKAEVPEITNACWGILNKRPVDVMCATSRMIVKRKGADRPTVLPCTLIPYQPQFDMGPTLTEAGAADGGMFDKGAVKLCHVHCAKFCVLGGGSCS